MTLMLCIMAFIVGIVATLFANGVFSLKETLAEIWRSQTIASAVLLGLIGTVGIFQHWTMASALCVFLLCGMVVLTKFMAKDEVNERIRDVQFWNEIKMQELVNAKDEVNKRITDMQFWIEVKLQGLINAVDERFEDEEPNGETSLKDQVSGLIEEKYQEILDIANGRIEEALKRTPSEIAVSIEELQSAEPKDGKWVIKPNSSKPNNIKEKKKTKN